MTYQYILYNLNLTSDTFAKIGQIGKIVPNWKLFLNLKQDFLILFVTKTLYSNTLCLIVLLLNLTVVSAVNLLWQKYQTLRYKIWGGNNGFTSN